MKEQKSAVLQMFYGENGRMDNIVSPPEAGELLDAVDEAYKLLYEKLQPQAELWELFLKYKRSLEKLLCFEGDVNYAEGFKFGLLIGVEAGESKYDKR